MATTPQERTWRDLPRAIVADVVATTGRPVPSALDRQGLLRRDQAHLDGALAHPDCRILVIYEGAHVALAPDGGLSWTDPAALGGRAELSSDALRYLGIDDAGAPLFSYEHPDPPATDIADSLREALGTLSDFEAAAALEAVALSHWHRRHRYCANCSALTNVVDGGHARHCRSCNTRHFPRTDPTVIMLVTNGEHCVLGRRVGAPVSRWSTLAGFIEIGESAEEAVAREVAEEVGLTIETATYRGSQPWPFPASLMLSYRATAAYTPLTVDEEHLEVRWFSRAELREQLGSGEITIPPPIAAGHQLIMGFLEEA